MSINALDQSTVKFLTTSQVISSVTTAVKELVENSIDAGAGSIEIKLVDNGASLIEVSDDGKGIAASDTPFMALQSYTSKIRDFNDLDSLRSYGFRGEALSSLCRVAEVTVITKTINDEAARAYHMDHNGCIERLELCHHSVGTTIRAKSLFKDLPVRRQIITSSKRTNQDVKSLVRSYGICQPKIRLNLRINANNVVTKPSTETLRETLSCLYGNKFLAQVDFVEKEIFEAKIELSLPRADATEFNELSQVGGHIFVNQRPVFYKEIEKIIITRLHDHFGEKIPSRKKLGFILSLIVPPADLDVNLEPNKTSVLLINQKKIIEALDELLTNFYGIVENSPAESSEKMTNNGSKNSETLEASMMNDSMEINSPPSSKKPRLELTNKKSPRPKENAGKSLKSNKENRLSDFFAPKKIDDGASKNAIVETISQLPIVDLGEDFDIEEITNLPNLDPAQVTTILGNMSVDNGNSENVKPIDTRNLTLEAWSKGQVPVNLRGGTDVRIYGNSGDTMKPEMEETTDSEPSTTRCRGFIKFSKEIRPLIIEENPGINFVEMAKSLMARWRELSPEERGYYRDLAASEAIKLNKYDTSAAPTRSQKVPKLTSDGSERNRKRLLDLLDNMKNPKSGKKKDIFMKRTVLPLAMSMESLKGSFFNRDSIIGTRKNRKIVLGAIDENLWIARTGLQVWALNLPQLLRGLGLDDSNSIERTRDTVEELVEKWLRNEEGMSLLHPVFRLR